MTRITPNFNFDGRCADAIALYEQAFHAQVDYVLRYRDADPQDLSMTLTKEQEDYVYHAEMHIGGQRIPCSAITWMYPFRPAWRFRLP